jgi:hypothetical protein
LGDRGWIGRDRIVGCFGAETDAAVLLPHETATNIAMTPMQTRAADNDTVARTFRMMSIFLPSIVGRLQSHHYEIAPCNMSVSFDGELLLSQ